MAVGKNKRKPKKGAKKKKIIDPFSRKEWYDIKAPAKVFTHTDVGKTMINQTQGKFIASEQVKGRVFEVSVADLTKDEERAFRTISLIAEDVQGKTILTNFHGMKFTTDKVKSLVKKWQTLIEGNVEVKTTDGYYLRLFAIGFTKKRPNQLRLTSYAQTSQIKQIRKRMVDIMVRESMNCDIVQLFKKFNSETIGKLIEAECQGIYPLKDCFIRKAKIIRRPKFDPVRLADLHSEGAVTEDTGAPVGGAKKSTK